VIDGDDRRRQVLGSTVARRYQDCLSVDLKVSCEIEQQVVPCGARASRILRIVGQKQLGQGPAAILYLLRVGDDVHTVRHFAHTGCRQHPFANIDDAHATDAHGSQSRFVT
jgi:hypothetical protein